MHAQGIFKSMEEGGTLINSEYNVIIIRVIG